MTTLPRTEYPRPDFVRDSFVSLNGEWSFVYDDDNRGFSEKWYEGTRDVFDKKIIVPYTYLCELSGINDQDFHDIVWYQRKVSFKSSREGSRFLLHFGAIDHVADIWIDSDHVCHHEGGNTPIDIDVTDAVAGTEEHLITVRAFDDSGDFEMTRGKQFWKRQSEGIFYTRTVGIWQSVWFEEVPEVYLSRVRITPDLDERMIEIEMFIEGAKEATASIDISLKGQALLSDDIEIKNGKAKLKYWLDSSITLDWHHQESWTWSPENPVLFDIVYRVCGVAESSAADTVTGYFAFRKINVVNGRILLNNRPYYMKMLLDQGYFRKGLLTAPTDDDLRKDIEYAKEMGFNGVRKHQKVEDPRYLYWADKLGFLVWGEGPSSYEYSELAVDRHTREWLEILKRDYNHPCIIAWVPLNESWGVHEILDRKDEQAHSLGLYYLVKSIDQTRLVISNDGWTHTKSDIISIHDYSGDRDELTEHFGDLKTIVSSFPGGHALFANGYQYHGEPIMVTEFGGISFCKDGTEGWGYTAASDQEDFLTRYRNVVEPLLDSPYVQGFVYTQLTDVEQEINGLMTYDREFKVPPEKIRKINR
ncbi:glycoside hydrolase family 2 [Butyrivibrio sp. CB08]|uniref:glycoside hydrolase family 2 protein n=1 Tax=Butyrivibrio sp. CB08 TaxID=2364879 RepID=UPI000EAACD36|nr:sugar-binding domain-containing protein [Butyrivibrio sp. CB08]RKM62006.1 glycoside hydrolase family 2 [Butyrivibrio sp. CB08]